MASLKKTGIAHPTVGQTFSLPHGAGRRAVGRASLVETYFWHVYKTQHVQLYLDIHAKPLGGRNIFKILGVEKYFWDLYNAQQFQFYPDISAKHLGLETYS